MNINQIGQKKKKQAVRRLSQSSPSTHGNRKDDIRRKLEANRLAANRFGANRFVSNRLGANRLDTQGSGTRVSRVPYSRRGKSFDRNAPSAPRQNRNFQSSQIGMRKHVSPLVNSGASEDSTNASETSHPTSTSTSKLSPSISKSPVKDNNKQENVFGSSLFQTSAKHENVFGSSQFETSAKKTVVKHQGNTFVSSQTEQQSGNVFGALTSTKPIEKPGNISKMPMFDTNISKSGNVTKIFQSPLTNVGTIQGTTNSQRNIFGASTTEKSHSGKQESIFTSSEKNPGNVFNVQVTEPANNFSNAPQTYSTTSSSFSAQSITQTKAHPSPFAGLISGQNNSGNIFGKTTTSVVLGEEQLSFQSDRNLNKETDSSASNVFVVTPAHESVFGSVVSSQKGITSFGSKKADGDGQHISPFNPIPPNISLGGTSLQQQGSVFGSAALPPSSTGYSNSSLFQTPMLPQAKLLSNITLTGRVKLPLSTANVLNQSGQTATNFSGSIEGRKSVGGTQETEIENILSSDRVVSPKALKRSISTDVSGITSIVIKGLTKEYFNKELLTEYLSVYGKIKKIVLQPVRGNAMITFNSHESAKKAKLKALELFPLKEIGVFWRKRKRSSSECSTIFSKAGHKTLSEVNKRELNSRKMSISNALRNINADALPPALNAQERFAILDEIDKTIRQAVKPYTDLATAPTIVGVCPDMCPEKERYMREARVNLSIFEMIPGTQDNRDGDVPRVDHTRAVKEYSRSAADQLEPLAHEMRPVAVLQITLDYLAANVMDNGEGRWGEWFNFLWDRTRAIRKEISQQHFCNVECVELVEKITRFHIFCAHYLCEEDMHSFDPKINNENLTKCLQTLKQFYLDLYSYQNTVCCKEAEFQAYDILLNLNEGDTLRKAMQYRMEVRNSPEVTFALKVFSSLNSNNYVRFFKLLRSASYLNACIMHRYFTQVRSRALETMTKAYRPQVPYPQQALLDLLAFEDKGEVTQFCQHYNFTTSNDSVMFSKLPFVEPETVYPLQRAESAIETKRNCLIGEVVSGSPLQAQQYHEPLCSFDSNGRYTGLASLVELLGGTAIPVEPESPDILYESVVSVPTEQQSPEVAQHARAEDDTQIMMQEIRNVCDSLLGEAVDGLVNEISEDVISEAKLKLEVSKIFADRFLAKSLLVVVREVVKQCVDDEIKIKRETIAVIESRNRASAMILREIVDDVLKSELRIVAKNVRSEVDRKLRAQSFIKMSAAIMKEMTEEIVSEQCRDIAFTSRKETIDRKKAVLWELAKVLFKKQQEKYFKRWCKQYDIRMHIKDILHQMPAMPPMLTTKQQVQKLFNDEKDFGVSSAELSQSQLMRESLPKERAGLQHHLKEMVEEQELKRIRAREPLDIPRILSENTVCEDNLLKLVISLPQNPGDDSFVTVDELIKSAFSCREAEIESSRVTTALEDKVESLSSYTSRTQSTRNTREFKIDIKACYGVLARDESLLVQEGHLFLGITGILFLLKSSGQHRHEMFWTRSRTRLRQILKSKPPVPSIPLVILNFGCFSSDDESVIEMELNLGWLVTEGLLSHWVVYQQDEIVDSDDLLKQLVQVIQWLACHPPSLPSIKSEKLKSLVEKEVLNHFTIPLYEEIALRRQASLKPQCPEVVIELYNTVIDHITNVVTDAKLKDISWPIPEFVITTREDLPNASWNSPETFQRLHDILGKLKLSPAPSPAEDGKWKTECVLCLDYINILLSEEPLKNFSFSLVNSVERILNQLSEGKRDHSSTTLTAADVPWPQVIETCVGTLLSWLHSTPPSLTKENVYYVEEDLENFTEPALWSVAVTETLKLAKKTSGTREKEKKLNKLHNLTLEVEEELQKIKSTPHHVNVPKSRDITDDNEQKVRLLDEKLDMEKRNCERFEDHLRSLLEEGAHVRPEVAQGIKRKCNPRWPSNSKPGKVPDICNAFVKNVNTEIEGIDLPDLSSTMDSIETSLITFQEQLKLQRHVEDFTEQQLRQHLE